MSVLITTNDEIPRIIDKQLLIHVKDKNDFNLTLSNNKVNTNTETIAQECVLLILVQIMENSHENTLVGDLVIENGIGNYTMDLVDNSNGQFRLNGTSLLVWLH